MSGVPQEIPMKPGNREFAVNLAGKPYLVRQLWNDCDPFSPTGSTYHIDIGDGITRKLMIAGIALVTGTDLLGQYAHMDFGGKLVVTSDNDSGDCPTYDGLGLSSRLFFIPD